MMAAPVLVTVVMRVDRWFTVSLIGLGLSLARLVLTLVGEAPALVG